MFKRCLLVFLLLSVIFSGAFSQSAKPNIIIIYADDLGYGDVGCYGAKNVLTQNIDKLAANGLRFTDAHCTAATCTPSRYSILTGSYAFRSGAAILPGDAPLIIKPNTPTLPGMLQDAGYTTAVIGKWHLGLGNGNIDWNKHIKSGPAEVGFNYSFIIPATLDRVPTVFIENQDVVNLDPNDPITVSYAHKIGNDPTGYEQPDLLKFSSDTEHSKTIVDSISRIGWMSGGNAARWNDETMADVLMQKTKTFITQNAQHNFFLYLAYTDIHVPRDPNPRFVGKSSMGRRGDAIAQMDWMTGEVTKLLDSLHLSQNTLIIFSSDNGPVLNDGYDDKAEELVGDHKPAGPFNGGKYSAFEAGTRVPTIVYWPGKVKPGISDAIISQVDLFASLAHLTNQQLKSNAAPDSFDMLNALLGNSKQGRKIMLEESGTLALRVGDWKYIATFPKPNFKTQIRNNATGFSTQPQLYYLKNDVGEKHDVSSVNKDQLIKMQSLLDAIKQAPSRPGFKQ